jgi:hypothetical protein
VRTLPPLVTCIRSLNIEVEFEEEMEAKLLVQRFAHGRGFHPAFEVEVIGSQYANFHQERTHAAETMRWSNSQPVER